MAVEKPDKKFRQYMGPATEDAQSIENNIYNETAGGQKNVQVGGLLQPLNLNATQFTTDATTARRVRPGTSLYIYNNSNTLYSVTVSDNPAIAALAPGATNAAGDVGVPCKPNDWTHLNVYDKPYVITNNALLLVFKLKDETYITSQKQS